MIINKGTRAGAGFDNNFMIYPITNFLRQFAYTTSIYITVGLSLERQVITLDSGINVGLRLLIFENF